MLQDLKDLRSGSIRCGGEVANAACLAAISHHRNALGRSTYVIGLSDDNAGIVGHRYRSM